MTQETDSQAAGPGPGRTQAASEDGGCGDRDIQLNSGSELENASFSFANVVSKAGAAL